MEIEFRDAYCRWHVPVYEHAPGKKRPPDELHVTPKADKIEIRDQLAEALESGELVSDARGYNTARYKVLREKGGTFVLVNTKGGRR